MKDHAIVITLFRQQAKVLSGFRGVVLKQFEFDRAFIGLNSCRAIWHLMSSLLFWF
jgi:hypothetical protein